MTDIDNQRSNFKEKDLIYTLNETDSKLCFYQTKKIKKQFDMKV